MGKDISDFCLHFLNGGLDFETLNYMNIVLIPKCSHPDDMTKFRRISLCNVLYKLITKIIINRLCVH